jgi:concanavalin A-like lectin/glucanase superfamily protein
VQYRWLALVVTGCSFQPHDAPAADGLDAGTPTNATRTCRTTDHALELCLEFEDAGDPMPRLLLDGSGHTNDATPTEITATQGDVGQGVAFSLLARSRLDIAATPDLDLTDEVTLEMWVREDQGPPMGPQRGWLIDHDGAYFMSIGSDLLVQCGYKDSKVVESGQVVAFDEPDRWQHVACTIGRTGPDHEVRVYIDGDLTECKKFSDQIPSRSGGTTIGMKFGSTTIDNAFVGSLDGVHVYGRALAPTEVCAAAGQSKCFDQCPTGFPGI